MATKEHESFRISKGVRLGWTNSPTLSAVTHKARKVEMPLTQRINIIAAEGEVLVACILCSCYSDFHLGQWLQWHVPLRDIADLWDDRATCERD